MGNIVKKVALKLFEWQLAILNHGARFKLIRAGCRTGKSWLAVAWIIKRAGEIPNGIHWYVAQTNQQARDICWPLLKTLIPREMMSRPPLEVYKEIHLVNGSVIALKSAETDDNLRGSGINSLVCEEYAFWQRGDLYETVLRMRIADKQGHVMFISSPNGSNHFRKKEAELLARIKAGDDSCAVWHLTTWDNPIISRAELEELKRTMPEEKYLQEVMGEYVDRCGLVYFEATEDTFMDLQGLPRRTMCGLDWGLEDYAAAAWTGIMNNGVLFTGNEWQIQNTAAAVCARQIREKTGRNQTEYVMDSSAWKRDGTSLISVADEYSNAGIRALKATRHLDASISSVKLCLAAGLLKISPNCRNIRAAMSDWQWGSHEPDILAALRYGVSYIYDYNLSPLIPHLKTAQSPQEFREKTMPEVIDVLAKSKQPLSNVSILPKPNVSREEIERKRFGDSGPGFSWNSDLGTFERGL